MLEKFKLTWKYYVFFIGALGAVMGQSGHFLLPPLSALVRLPPLQFPARILDARKSDKRCVMLTRIDYIYLRLTRVGHGSGSGSKSYNPDPNPQNPDPNPRVCGSITGLA